MPDELELLRGTLDLLVLQAVSGRPLHGYAVLKWIRESSRNALDVEERALYVALHRLEGKKQVKGRWDITGTGRRAKSYEITAAGRKRLERDTGRWQQYVRAMGHVLSTMPEGR
jgi:transcriptional regulator